MPEQRGRVPGTGLGSALPPSPPAQSGTLHLRQGPSGSSPCCASGDKEPAPMTIWKGDIGKLASQSAKETEGSLIRIFDDPSANAKQRRFVSKEERAAPETWAELSSRSWDTGEHATSDPPRPGSRRRTIICHDLNHLQRFGRKASPVLFVGKESTRRREAPHLSAGGG